MAGWLQRQLMDLFHSLSLRVLHKVFFLPYTMEGRSLTSVWMVENKRNIKKIQLKLATYIKYLQLSSFVAKIV